MFSRSYTPPTCTLKVTAKGLAILKLIGIPIKQSFQLSFDDPRVSEAEHISLRGNRSELDTLHKVVTTYVQDFINNSPKLPLDLENTGVEDNKNVASQNPYTKIQAETQETANETLSNPNSQSPVKGKQGIYLQQHDLLTHNLFLGSLANKESGNFISLSMLQLFDLAIALDECETDLKALPQFKSDDEVKSIPEWLGSLVLIIITAAVTAAAIKLYDRYAVSRQQSDQTITSLEPTNENNQSSQTSPAPSPLPKPAVTSSPPTNLPTPTISPGNIIKPSPIPTPSPLFPRPNPAPPAPANLPSPPTDVSRHPENQGTTPTVVIPASPPLAPPPLFPPAIPNYGVSVQPRPPVQPAPNLRIQPGQNQAPSPVVNRRGLRPYLDVSSIPVNVPRVIDLPPLQDTEPVALRDREPTVEPSSGQVKPKSLFDKIPQVAEVREYFENSWEPPSDLDRNLQYSLLLNGDGSVKKVTPIGIASVEFYGNTNMPLEEQAFVSNIEGGKTAQIRLILNSDGQVRTFLESLN